MKYIYKAELTRKDAPNLFCVAENLQQASKMLEEYLEEQRKENPMCYDLDIEGYVIETEINSISLLTRYVRC